jgi:HK97 family phage major capsid protein
MRRRAFPGSRQETEARYQRAAQWLLATIYGHEKARDWCKSNGIAIVKASTETIDSSGGFLVPVELANAILDLRDIYGAFRRRARLVPMKSDTTMVPRHNDGITSFFVAENTSSSTTQANIDQISLTAKKIGALVLISSEMEEDAAVEMVDFLANEIAYAFAKQEDLCAFNGDGTSTYGRMRGISTIVLDGNHNKAKVTAATGDNTFLTLTSIDLGNLMSSVQASAIPNAAWYCSQTCFAQAFCRLAGGTGYLPMAETDGIMTPHYLGFPVILTQALPMISTTLTGQVMLVFGDMYRGGVLGQRRGITLARSADRYLDSDQIAVLGTERFHAVVHSLGDNTNFGAVAALVAP